MDIIKFLIFISYCTCVFFFPNNSIVLVLLFLNLIVIIFTKINLKKIIKGIKNILPFIIFTFLINCFLDEIRNSIYIGIKLIIVCMATFTYSYTTNIYSFAKTIEKLFSPLELFKINTKDISLLISISLAMIPILRKEFTETKEACIAKNILFNLKNSKYIFSKYFISLIKRANEIEEALISKGYS